MFNEIHFDRVPYKLLRPYWTTMVFYKMLLEYIQIINVLILIFKYLGTKIIEFFWSKLVYKLNCFWKSKDKTEIQFKPLFTADDDDFTFFYKQHSINNSCS